MLPHPLCPALCPFTVNSVVLMVTMVRRFYSIANNTLTWLLPLALEENQYNIWVQMANSHHRKCKLRGAGSSLLRYWSEHWTLHSQPEHPSWPLHSLYLSPFFFHCFSLYECRLAGNSNCRVNTAGQVKRFCLCVFLLKFQREASLPLLSGCSSFGESTPLHASMTVGTQQSVRDGKNMLTSCTVCACMHKFVFKSVGGSDLPLPYALNTLQILSFLCH